MAELTLDGLVDRIAAAAAESASRYFDASGLAPDHDMPEYVLAAGVLYDLSRTFTMTLETNVRKLIDWSRASLPEPGSPQAAILAQPMDQLRVDLVVFQRTGATRSDDPLFAMVEFKRHKISESDRQKILRMSELVPACRYGLVCSVVDAPHDSEWLLREERDALARYEGVVRRVPVVLREPLKKSYAIFAHGFELKAQDRTALAAGASRLELSR